LIAEGCQMADCQLISTAVGGLVGFGSSFATVWITGKHRREEREAATREAGRTRPPTSWGASGRYLPTLILRA
jgi:hypothetical protein